MREPPNEKWWVESKSLFEQIAQTCIYENIYILSYPTCTVKCIEVFLCVFSELSCFISTNTTNAYYFRAENGLFEDQSVPTRTGQLTVNERSMIWRSHGSWNQWSLFGLHVTFGACFYLHHQGLKLDGIFITNNFLEAGLL